MSHGRTGRDMALDYNSCRGCGCTLLVGCREICSGCNEWKVNVYLGVVFSVLVATPDITILQGKQLGNVIKIGFMIGIGHETSRILATGHILAKMKASSEHEFMIVT